MAWPGRLVPGLDHGSGHIVARHRPGAYDIGRPAWRIFHQGRNGSGLLRIEKESGERGSHSGRVVRSCPSRPDHSAADAVPSRSEEHTSELQSLMRISYAVFCLKKKNYHTNATTYR